jgi:DNA invertase Pin-like site-specific DNA recombinase
MAAVAELKAGMISSPTKVALAAAKARGTKPGGNRGAKLSAKARAAGRAAVVERAEKRAADLSSTIFEVQSAGARSLRSIAAALNDRSIPTARGAGRWSAVQVSRVLAQL